VGAKNRSPVGGGGTDSRGRSSTSDKTPHGERGRKNWMEKWQKVKKKTTTGGEERRWKCQKEHEIRNGITTAGGEKFF